MAHNSLYDTGLDVLRTLARGQFPERGILLALANKGLSWGLVAGGSVVKLPQLVSILRSRSTAGLSTLSIELETLACAVQSMFAMNIHLPFSAYGEAVVLLIQNILIALCAYYFSGLRARGLTAVVIVVATAALYLGGHLSPDLVNYLYEINNVTVIASRVPQIYQNWSHKSSGALSSLTVCLMFMGGCARVFSTIQEGGGSAMVRSYMLGACLNFILLAQIYLYSSNQSRARGKGKGSTTSKPKRARK